MKAFILKNNTNANNVVTKEETKDQRKEIISKRTTFAKHFINSDGTYTMEVSPIPVHYYDSNKKTYEEIDNTLIETNDKFSIKQNKMKLSFNKEINSDTPLFDLENNGYNFQLFYLGKKEKSGSSVLKKAKGNSSNLTKQVSNLTYENIASDIDLEYCVQSNLVKENIIIKKKQESYEFSFLANIGKLNARLSEDESCIELIDKQQKVHYIIHSPIMFDSSNSESTDLGYEIGTSNDGNLIFTLKATSEWINAEERVFPVTIDPEVEVTIDDKSIVKHYQINKELATIAETRGYIDNMSQSRAYLIAFDLKEFLSAKIFSAELLFETVGSMPFDAAIKAYYYGISASEANSNSFSIDAAKETSYMSFYGPTSGNVTINIIDAFTKWLDEKSVYGALLFRSTDVLYSPYTFTPPTLSINYSVQIPVPDFYYSLKNECITEILSNVEVGLENKIIENGLLITHVDKTNEKVYQTLRVNDNVYTRNSINSENWSEWKNQSLRAEFVDGTLYLTDED